MTEEEKIVIRVSKGITVRVKSSTHDWVVIDEKTGKVIEEGKKT